MKKFIAAILSMTLTCGTAQYVLAEESITDERDTLQITEKDIEIQNAYKVLTELGIEEYASEEKVSFSISIKRGDFAVLLCKLLNQNSGGDFEFADVRPGSEYYDAVSSLAGVGVVNGNGGYYRPYEYITRNEAIKMVVYALGYSNICTKSGGYPVGSNVIAGELDLLDYLLTGDEYMSYGEIMLLLYNSLDAEMTEITSVTDNRLIYDETEDENILSAYHNIGVIKGVVTADNKTAIDSRGGAVGDENIRIDSTVFTYEQDDIDELLGYRVIGYYDKESYVLKSVVHDKKNSVLTVPAEDIAGFDTYTMIFNYYENEKLKYVKLNVDTNVIFNGRAYDKEITRSVFMPDSGEVIFIDNDDDGKYDTAFINSYFNYIVKAVSADEEVISDVIGIQPVLKLKDKNYSVVNGDEEVNLNAVTAGSILMVAPDTVKEVSITNLQGNPSTALVCDVDNSEFIDIIIVSNNVIKGKYTASDDENMYIDGTPYKLSQAYSAYSKLSNYAFIPSVLGETISCYLDKYGKIVYIKGAANDDYSYGWLVSLHNDTDNERIIIRLFSQSGKMLKVNVTEDISVTRMWGSDLASVYAKKIEDEDLLTLSEIYNSEAKQAIPQLIKFRQAEDGCVNGIMIAVTKPSGERLSKYENVFSLAQDTGKDGGLGYDETKTLATTYELNSSTIFFDVPDSADVPEKYYSVKTNPSFATDTTISYISVYDVSASGYVDVLVQRNTYDLDSLTGTTVKRTGRTDSFVFDKLSYGLSRDEEPCIKVNGYKAGKYVTYDYLDENTLGNEIESSVPVYSAMSKLKITDLKKGDQLLVNVNSFNELTGFLPIMHDITAKDSNGDDILMDCRDWTTEQKTKQKYYGASVHFKGRVDEIVSNILYVDCGGTYLRRLKKFSYVYKYDTEADELSVCDYSAVLEGDMVCAYMTYGDYRTLVVIK